jgi:hypothetical protein
MKLFAAIRMPEKSGFYPVFIGDFGQPSKNRQIMQPVMVAAASW